MQRIVLSCLIIAACLYASPSSAQTAKTGYGGKAPLFGINKADSYTSDATKSNFLFHSSPVAFQAKSTINIESAVCYTAFFCKMETTLRKHLNIWVKFRVGDDDIYRQMTLTGNH